MITGTVKFFNADKGYGFIQPEDGSSDAFVHISAVESAGMRTLDREQRLNYDLETDRNGRASAVNLQAARSSLYSAPQTCGAAEPLGKDRFMSTLQFYNERAADCRRHADDAQLANVRARCLSSASAWDDMADRVRRTQVYQAANAAGKAAETNAWCVRRAAHFSLR